MRKHIAILMVLGSVYSVAAFSALPPCVIHLNMNDNEVNSVFIRSELGNIETDLTGISNPIFPGGGEPSIFKVNDTSYIGWRNSAGYVYYMTSQDGLIWDTCTPIISFYPPVADGNSWYNSVVKVDSNYYMFVKNAADGNEYCYDVTKPTAPLLMNNGLPVLVRAADANVWGYHLYNVGVAEVNGTFYMACEGGPSGFTTGFASATPQHIPPTTTDNMTFTMGTNNPVISAMNPYLIHVPDRNALLVVATVYDFTNRSSTRLFRADLASDLNLPANWVLGARICMPNSNAMEEAGDQHLITNYSATHPILMIWKDNTGIYECYINLTLNQLYDSSFYKTAAIMGTNSTSAQRTIAGKIKDAINFNGSDNFVVWDRYKTDFPRGIFPVLDWNNVDFSVSVWAKQDANGAIQGITSSRGGSGGGYWEMAVNAAGFYFMEFPGRSQTTTFKPALDTWNHYVLTVNHTTRTAMAYFNNVVFTPYALDVNVGNLESGLVLGANSQNFQYWNGDIDAFMVFSGVLSAGDVAYLYNNGNGRENSSYPRRLRMGSSLGKKLIQ